jgi:hypothetical protein
MRDTVVISGGRVTVAFDADNPGEWMLTATSITWPPMMTTVKYAAAARGRPWRRLVVPAQRSQPTIRRSAATTSGRHSSAWSTTIVGEYCPCAARRRSIDGKTADLST